MNDYVASMRKLIGNETLLTVGCGIIIEDEHGRILLQSRKDEPNWCIPGGVIELGETFVEAALREVQEETNLTVRNPKLFGIYSGEKCFVTYPNGHKVFSVQVIFHGTEFEGVLTQEGTESHEHRFFSSDELPAPLNPRQAPFILDWKHGKPTPIIS